jgi:hypothetical protein
MVSYENKFGVPYGGTNSNCWGGENMDKRVVKDSQEEYRALTSTVPQERYCRGCILVPGCNVILKDGESCGDRYDGAVQPIDYRMNELEYDEWEALGDNVPEVK